MSMNQAVTANTKCKCMCVCVCVHGVWVLLLLLFVFPLMLLVFLLLLLLLASDVPMCLSHRALVRATISLCLYVKCMCVQVLYVSMCALMVRDEQGCHFNVKVIV